MGVEITGVTLTGAGAGFKTGATGLVTYLGAVEASGFNEGAAAIGLATGATGTFLPATAFAATTAVGSPAFSPLEILA